MALGAGQLPEFGGVHPLDGGAGLFGQRNIVGRHSRGHPFSQQDAVHPGAAFQQLGHRVFAVDQTSAGLGVLVLPVFVGPGRRAEAARSVFFHRFCSSLCNAAHRRQNKNPR